MNHIIKIKIDFIIFKNPDTDFFIAKFSLLDGVLPNKKIDTIKGAVPSVYVGMVLDLEATITCHPTYGDQLDIISCTNMPKSSMLKTVEELLIERLVFYMPQNYVSDELQEVKSKSKITKKKLETFITLFKKNEHITEIEENHIPDILDYLVDGDSSLPTTYKDIVASNINQILSFVYLKTLGFTENDCSLIAKHMIYEIDKNSSDDRLSPFYKLKEFLEINPYLLMEEIILPFSRFDAVDTIALESFGFDEYSIERLESLVLYELTTKLKAGDTFADFSFFEENNLSIEAIKNLSKRERIHILSCKIGGDDGVYFPNESGYNEVIAYKVTYTIALIQLYYAERNISNRLKHLTAFETPESTLDVNQIIEKSKVFEYSDEQKQAIKNAIDSRVSIITGPPGTGKTTIIKAIINLFVRHKLNDVSNPVDDVAICCPTGKAAKNVSSRTGFSASTMHRLLGFTKNDKTDEMFFRKNSSDPLTQKLFIVDEFSMVDVVLFSAFLDAVRSDAVLVLIGDKDQLPPVGPGAPLLDMIKSKKILVSRLNTIFRTGEGSKIPLLAKDILDNNFNSFSNYTPDVEFIDGGNDTNLFKRALKKRLKTIKDSGEEEFFNETQILIPTKKDPVGTFAINKFVQENLNKNLPIEKTPFKVGDKIMQTENNYDTKFVKNIGYSKPTLNIFYNRDKGIFNGESGKILGKLAIKKLENTNDKVVVYPPIMTSDKKPITTLEIDRTDKSANDSDIPDDLFGEKVEIAFDEFSPLLSKKCLTGKNKTIELAYAMTIHKSQGSEYKTVFLILHNSVSRRLKYMNLIYTAITRAKKKLVIIGTTSEFEKYVKNRTEMTRKTMLKKFLCDEMGLTTSENIFI